MEKNLPKVLLAAKKYDKNTEIIVVDDKSTDNSKDIINNYSDIAIITKDKNEGFSSTVNRGVKEATGDIMVLLNTDVYPELNFLEPLVVHFEDTAVFAVGCLDKSMENGKEILRGRGIGRFKNGFLMHSRGETEETNTLWASGGSSAFDKNKWKELGGMDEMFNPFYWEDIDLSYRAQKRGWRVIFETKSIVHHHHEKGAIKSKFSDEEIKIIAYRNQFLFVWKNITDKNLLWNHVFNLPINLLKAIFDNNWGMLKGFIAATFRLPQVIYYRATVRGSITSDANILKDYVKEI